MSEIWGVFTIHGRLIATRTTEALAVVSRNIHDATSAETAPHTVARLYTAAEVRAILSDMPEASARFEGAK